jgi:hypothetical protein
VLVQEVDADVVAPDQRDGKRQGRADCQGIAAQLVGALEREVEQLARDRLGGHQRREREEHVAEEAAQ